MRGVSGSDWRDLTYVEFGRLAFRRVEIAVGGGKTEKPACAGFSVYPWCWLDQLLENNCLTIHRAKPMDSNIVPTEQMVATTDMFPPPESVDWLKKPRRIVAQFAVYANGFWMAERARRQSSQAREEWCGWATTLGGSLRGISCSWTTEWPSRWQSRVTVLRWTKLRR